MTYIFADVNVKDCTDGTLPEKRHEGLCAESILLHEALVIQNTIGDDGIALVNATLPVLTLTIALLTGLGSVSTVNTLSNPLAAKTGVFITACVMGRKGVVMF